MALVNPDTLPRSTSDMDLHTFAKAVLAALGPHDQMVLSATQQSAIFHNHQLSKNSGITEIDGDRAREILGTLRHVQVITWRPEETVMNTRVVVEHEGAPQLCHLTAERSHLVTYQTDERCKAVFRWLQHMDLPPHTQVPLPTTQHGWLHWHGTNPAGFAVIEQLRRLLPQGDARLRGAKLFRCGPVTALIDASPRGLPIAVHVADAPTHA